ncbi:rhodanese-like domain-containing protein [Gimesia algae]|uniref:rhodanese-like domain-containing protein n=1 Tax=Gimesia algae TaxID=2527971 RepID=UPI0018D5DA3F|nr:rhodanese-like domain-containing protein [Gimesia algae]
MYIKLWIRLKGACQGDQFEEQILKEILDKNQTIIVYSLNFECKNSEQAMQCLLKLGYQSVYDYEPGKVDWNAAQLPIEHGPSESNAPDKQQGFLSFVE